MEEDDYSFYQSLLYDSAEESSINDYDPTKETKRKKPEPSFRRGCYKKRQIKKPCLIHGCPDPFYSKLLCRKHYRRSLRFQMGTCSIDGCKNKIRQRELCYKHYEDWKKDGMDESSTCYYDTFDE